VARRAYPSKDPLSLSLSLSLSSLDLVSVVELSAQPICRVIYRRVHFALIQVRSQSALPPTMAIPRKRDGLFGGLAFNREAFSCSRQSVLFSRGVRVRERGRGRQREREREKERKRERETERQRDRATAATGDRVSRFLAKVRRSIAIAIAIAGYALPACACCRSHASPRNSD